MFYYSVNGQQMGPIEQEKLDAMVRSGALTQDALVWKEGMAQWEPYSKVLGGGVENTLVPCSVCKTLVPVDQTVRVGNQIVCASCKPKFVQGMREGVVSGSRGLYEIALNQRRALVCLGTLIMFNVAQAVLGQTGRAGALLAIVVALAGLVVLIFTIIAIYRLAKSLGLTAILYAILLIVPCLGLLMALVAISRATQRLKEAGIKVGLLGVSKSTLEQLRQAQ
jgi:hypothetical protein